MFDINRESLSTVYTTVGAKTGFTPRGKAALIPIDADKLLDCIRQFTSKT